MKAKEFLFEAKRPKIVMPKQRDPNWRTMQAKATSGAGGTHKDQKRAVKQGNVKHKKDLIPMEDQGVAEGSYTTEKQILTRIRQIMYDRKLSGTKSNAGELNRLKQQLKDIRSQQGMTEGDKKPGWMLRQMRDKDPETYKKIADKQVGMAALRRPSKDKKGISEGKISMNKKSQR
jgi:hypothetical protein